MIFQISQTQLENPRCLPLVMCEHTVSPRGLSWSAADLECGNSDADLHRWSTRYRKTYNGNHYGDGLTCARHHGP